MVNVVSNCSSYPVPNVARRKTEGIETKIRETFQKIKTRQEEELEELRNEAVANANVALGRYNMMLPGQSKNALRRDLTRYGMQDTNVTIGFFANENGAGHEYMMKQMTLLESGLLIPARTQLEELETYDIIMNFPRGNAEIRLEGRTISFLTIDLSYREGIKLNNFSQKAYKQP